MANIRTKDLVILIGEEASYGTLQTTPTTKFADVMRMAIETAIIEIKKNTGTIIKQDNESIAGLISANATLEGDLTDEHIEFVEQFFQESTSPYNLTTDDKGKSQSIIRYDNERSKYDYVSGARIAKLKISGDVGGTIKYSAEYRGKTGDYDATGAISALSLPDTDTTPPANEVMRFQNTECSLGAASGGISKLISFDLELNLEYCDDKVQYQNSQTKTQDTYKKVTGTLSYSYLSSDTAGDDDTYYDNIVGTLVADEIKIKDSTRYWDIVTYGKITKFDRDTSEDCLAVVTVEKDLVANSSNEMITVTTGVVA